MKKYGKLAALLLAGLLTVTAVPSAGSAKNVQLTVAAAELSAM